jgi:uncharacterized protein YcbX
MYKLTSIYIYPIKSLGGISLQSSLALEKGLEHDRRWMLIDDSNRFISQREHPQLALLKVEFTDGGFIIYHKDDKAKHIKIPFNINSANELDVSIWDDVCTALHYNDDVDVWFSAMLHINCRLVFMPENSNRLVDPMYTSNNETVSFSDGYPFLIIGEESLIDLNSKADDIILMNRFRPNLVFSGGVAFDEDKFSIFKIGSAIFKGTKPCARCVLTTINQETSIKGKEPLKTLATYRSVNNKVLFGQNLILIEQGNVSLGEELFFIEKSA